MPALTNGDEAAAALESGLRRSQMTPSASLSCSSEAAVPPLPPLFDFLNCGIAETAERGAGDKEVSVVERDIPDLRSVRAIEWNPESERILDDAVGCIKEGDGDAGVRTPVDGRSIALNGVNGFAIAERADLTARRSLASIALIANTNSN